MRVLMLSRDASGLKPGSAVASRWRLLRDAGGELQVFVSAASRERWSEAGLSVMGCGGRGPLTRVRNMYRMARRAEGVDLVTAQDPFELGFAAFLLSRKWKKPFEIQDHGGFFDSETPDEPLWFFRKHLARWVARRASRIRTVSPKSVAGLAALGASEKTYFLPIAADSRFARIERHPETDVIVTVSRLIPVKRVGLLLDVLSRVRDDRPSARLVIVGDGPEREALESRTRALNLTGAVTFAGEGDPSPWLAKAAVFVTLSAHEGWGIAAVEAAMAGVPVVMTDTGCAQWLAQQGFAMIVKNADEAKAGIEKILSEKSSRIRLNPQAFQSPTASAMEQVIEWKRVATSLAP